MSRSVPSTLVTETVQRYGIDFRPAEEVLKEFRKAGANDAVIAALREAWHPEPAQPLGEIDILVLRADN